MAVYYVATTGNNTNAGTAGAPWRTITTARARASSGDEIRVQPGDFTSEGRITAKSGVAFISTGKAALGEACAKIAGIGVVGGNPANITVDGFEVSGGSASAIGFASGSNEGPDGPARITIKRCLVYGSGQNGIAVNDGDLTEIDGNTVFDNDRTTGARSGISVLNARDKAGTTPANWEGFRTRVTNNICYKNGWARINQADADGNGIILDKFHYVNGNWYTGRSLVRGNLCYFNSGCGIKIMATTDTTVEYNTCFANKQNTSPGQNGPANKWQGEIQMQYAGGNVIRYNIAVSTTVPGAALTNFGDSSYDTRGGGKNGNTYTGNIIQAAGGNLAKATTANGYVVPPATGYTNADPQFSTIPTIGSPAGWVADLAVGSPARNLTPDSKFVGAWQTGTSPVTPVAITAAPVVTAADPRSGKAFTITAGTYSLSVTKTTKAQWLVNGVWTDLPSTVITNLLLPTLTAATDFRVVEVYTGTGVTNGENPSIPITITPIITVPGGTRKTPLYVGGSFKSASLDSGMSIPETYKVGTLVVAVYQISGTTAAVPPAPWTVLASINGSTVGTTGSTTIAYQYATATTGLTWGTWTNSAAGHKSTWQFDDAEISVAAVSSSLSGTPVTYPALSGMTAGSLVLYSLYSHLTATTFSWLPSGDFTERVTRPAPGSAGAGTSGDTSPTVLNAFAGGNVGDLSTAARLTYGVLAVRGVLSGTDDPTLANAFERIDDLTARLNAVEINVNGLPEMVEAHDDAISTLSGTVNSNAQTLADYDIRMSDMDTLMTELAARLVAVEAGGGGGGGGVGRKITIQDVTGPIVTASEAQRKALRDAISLKDTLFVGRLDAGSGTLDFTAPLTGGIGGTIQPNDMILEFGFRTNATLPTPSPALGWAQLFTDYSSAAPWQVLGWTRRFVTGDTDPMPTTHRKVALVFRNCTVGMVATPLTGTGTTASAPALPLTGGEWACALIVARTAQSDMDTALAAAGLTTRREFANGTDVNSYAFADSGAASNGFAQINQTVASGAWFGVSLALARL